MELVSKAMPPNPGREAFEEWAATEGYGPVQFQRMPTGEYHNVHVHWAWLGWQASRAPLLAVLAKCREWIGDDGEGPALVARIDALLAGATGSEPAAVAETPVEDACERLGAEIEKAVQPAPSSPAPARPTRVRAADRLTPRHGFWAKGRDYAVTGWDGDTALFIGDDGRQHFFCAGEWIGYGGYGEALPTPPPDPPRDARARRGA